MPSLPHRSARREVLRAEDDLDDLGDLRDLQAVMGERDLALTEILQIGVALGQALRGIHEASLMHRAVEPANVLVDEALGRVVLVDRGAATDFAAVWVDFLAAKRDLPYLAPEQTGRMYRAVDCRCDLYAAGAVLYALLVGAPPARPLVGPGPVPVHVHRRDLPRVVSDVVMRLLERSAEDRYQSASGLTHDLERCLDGLRDDGSLAPFGLGEADHPDRRVVWQRRYGRDDEKSRLSAGFDLASEGRNQLVLVAGPEGMGKTALAWECLAAVTERAGLFATGRFAPVNRSEPCGAVCDVIRDLVRQIRWRDAVTVAEQGIRIRETLGSSAGLMTELIPALEALIGPQPPAPQVEGPAAQIRFGRAVQALVESFATPSHPLVVFLDDLERADPFTLDLLGRLGQPEPDKFLLVIGAFRDDEVDATHPLQRSIWSLQDAHAAMAQLPLGPLSADETRAWVYEALRGEGHPPGVGIAIHEKSGGNPLIVQLLLRLLVRTDRDVLDAVAPGLPAVLSRLLDTLPEATLGLVGRAACIGPTFPLDAVARLAECAPQEAAARLREAVAAGLLLPVVRPEGPVFAYRFVHDRVREAAETRLGEVRDTVHLDLARRILASTAEEDLPQQSPVIAYHAGLASPAHMSEAERDAFANIHLRAAERAAGAKVPAIAADRYRAALGLMTPAFRENHRARVLNALVGYGECLHLTGEISAAEQVFERAVAQATDRREQALVSTRRSALAAHNLDVKGAIEVGLAGLAPFGRGIEAHPPRAAVQAQLREILRDLRGLQVEQILAMPPLHAPELEAEMKLLAAVATSAYIAGNWGLHTSLIVHGVALTLAHGTSSLGGRAFVALGTTVVATFGHYADGERFAQIGFAMLAKHPSPVLEAEALVAYPTTIQPWVHPVRDTLLLLRRGFLLAREAGALESAAFCQAAAPTHALFAGGSLQEVVDLARAAEAFCASVGAEAMQLQAAQAGEAARALMDRDRDPRLDPPHLGDLWGLMGTSPIFRFQHGIRRAFVGYLVGNLHAVATAIPDIEATMPLARGLLSAGYYWVIRALYECAIYREAGDARREIGEGEIAAMRGLLDDWATACPANGLPLSSLVQGAWSHARGDLWPALRHLDEATDRCAEQGFNHFEGVAHRLAGAVWTELGRDEKAAVAFQRARTAFARWGATRLVATVPALREV